MLGLAVLGRWWSGNHLCFVTVAPTFILSQGELNDHYYGRHCPHYGGH